MLPVENLFIADGKEYNLTIWRSDDGDAYHLCLVRDWQNSFDIIASDPYRNNLIALRDEYYKRLKELHPNSDFTLIKRYA